MEIMKLMTKEKVISLNYQSDNKQICIFNVRKTGVYFMIVIHSVVIINMFCLSG